MSQTEQRPAVTMRAAFAMTLVALALTACGLVPGTGSNPEPTPAPTVMPTYAPAPQPGGNQGPIAAAIQQVMATMKALPGYTCDLVYYQKTSKQISRGHYRLTGKAPRSLRIDIIEGEGKGSKLLWSGGNDMQVRPSGILSAVMLNLPITDERLVSIRGYSIAQMDLQALLGLLASPRNKVTLQGYRGDDAVLVAQGPDLLPGCTSMTVQINCKTLYPTLVDLSDPSGIVVHDEVQNFKPANPSKLEI